MITWIATGLFFIFCSLANAENITAIPRIVDGDTLVVSGTKVRLEGVDAPETDQICLDKNGARWTCGIEARNQLAKHIADRPISCSFHSTDVYRRALATCFVDGENLNGWLVQQGWALAYVQYSSAYIDAENKSRALGEGLWQGAFIAPWDWRHRNNKTTVLGTLSVPASAQVALLGPSAVSGAPTPECTIKGNTNRKGERIFHTEHQNSYAKIDMAIGNGRRWFCTPEEAVAAGWRPALR
jgi:endonuclease YncB( thermonuclease family)